MIYLQTLGITIFVFAASAILSIILTLNYLKSRQLSAVFWSAGMWLFAVSVFLEILFAYGFFSEALIELYLFLTALLVQLLSFGSFVLWRGHRARVYYGIYSVVTEVALIASLLMTTTGNIIKTGVVSGTLPLPVTVASVLITFPAAIILVLVAAITFRKTKKYKMLSIIIGTIVVAIAGTLYIASFPSFLYIAELIGILLLWLGFVNFSFLFKHIEVKSRVNS